MIDFARIKVIAGSGGNGAGSFFRTKGKRLGKADGGDGGRGGDVYFIASNDLNTLEPFRFVKEYKAKHGGNGTSNNRKGADGEELVIKVPAGTLLKLARFSESGEGSVYDLVEPGQRVLVARAGEGGRGNAHLRDEFGRRPKSAEKGAEGETVELTLELKLIADVGLIGLPNAGKSTLLAQMTKAHPAIANYPFTTLEPNLGVIDGSKFKGISTRLVFADIPGLIEGASDGKGLGHLFLRHIERTRVLVHLIDVSAGKSCVEVYKTVKNELKTYSGELAKKREIVVLNKKDLISSEELDEIVGQFKKMKKVVVGVSAKDGEGLELLLGKITKVLQVS